MFIRYLANSIEMVALSTGWCIIWGMSRAYLRNLFSFVSLQGPPQSVLMMKNVTKVLAVSVFSYGWMWYMSKGKPWFVNGYLKFSL